MASEIKDLDILFPDESEVFTFIGKSDRKKYTTRNFIPHGLGLYLSTKDDAPTADRQAHIVALYISSQDSDYAHVNTEWVKKNLSVQKQNVIFGWIIEEVGRSNSFLSSGKMSEMIIEEAKKLVAEMMKNDKDKSLLS